MILLPYNRRPALEGALPEATLDYLQNVGVPEHLELQGLYFVFDLTFRPCLSGDALEIGDVDQGFLSVALQRNTGFMGHFIPESPTPEFLFSNSSIEQFVLCVGATERLWEMEKTNLVRWEMRWKVLEDEIRRIDPLVLSTPENSWVTMIGELQDGII